MKIKSLIILFSLLLFSNCVKEFEEQSFENKKTFRSANQALLSVSYKMTTYKDFEIDRDKLSDIDLASVNPSNEKQIITLKLFENGQIRIEIENVDFNKKITIPHKTLPDYSPKIHKTIIQGNTANFYDKNGNLLNSENIPIPNNIELVNKIKDIKNKVTDKEINNLILTMNGVGFINNLNDFINNANQNNIIITDQGNDMITARFPLSQVAPGMSEQTVLLIDTKRNKLLGTRIYNRNDELLQSTLFAYQKGKIEALKAVSIKQLFLLPSGTKTYMKTISKIDDLKFNLNI